jgi:tRNA threonylcarbamoyladenosine biosynthesis protein TsaE
MKSLLIPSIEALDSVASEVAEIIKQYHVVCLYGEMGAGKTTLIKAICHALGVKDIVASPTFALINEYQTISGQPVYHFDFYRINRIEEVYDFGYEEYFFSPRGICLIEWPELVEDILPLNQTVKLYITVNPDLSRRIDIMVD